MVARVAEQEILAAVLQAQDVCLESIGVQSQRMLLGQLVLALILIQSLYLRSLSI